MSPKRKTPPKESTGRRPGRPVFGPQTQCDACGKPRTRWCGYKGKRHAACDRCYTRVLRGGDFFDLPKPPAVEHRKALLRARDLIRNGTSIAAAADIVGMKRRTLLNRLGRLASLETV